MLLNAKTKSKSDTIAEALRQQIESGELRPDDRVMSTRELSSHFGVSLVTANRALAKLNDEGLLKRNQRSGSFVRRRKTEAFRIGFADNVQRSELSFISEHYRQTVTEELYQAGCEIRLVNVHDIPTHAAELQLDGVLTYFPAWSREAIDKLDATGIPVVLCRYDYHRNLPFHQVMPDVCGAVYDVFRRIDRNRFSRLVIVYENHMNGIYRRDMAHKEAKWIGYADDEIELYEADFTMAERNFKLWQKIGRECSGKFIYCVGDVMAAGLVNVLESEGIVFGRDTELASYDNLEDEGFLPFRRPRVTSSGTPFADYARAAVRLLLHLVRNPAENRDKVSLRIGSVLRIRETAFASQKI